MATKMPSPPTKENDSPGEKLLSNFWVSKESLVYNELGLKTKMNNLGPNPNLTRFRFSLITIVNII